MKKTFIIIIVFFLIIMFLLFIALRNKQAENRSIAKQNMEYENFLNKKVYGTEIASLINKIVDHNEKNKVTKDNSGLYIENNENSIILKVNMKTVEETYRMELFYNNDITKFVQNFNVIQFECTDIKYNSKGLVKEIIFNEILEEEKNEG